MVLVLTRGALKAGIGPKMRFVSSPSPAGVGEAEAGGGGDRRSIHKPFW